MTDIELIKRAKNGDTAAFSTLVVQYSNAVYGVAYSFLGNYHEAQDIAQEVFFKAFLCLHQLNEPERIGSWLYAITRRMSIAFSKRRRDTLEFDEEWQYNGNESDGVVEMKVALDALSVINKQALILYYIAGYDTREISGFLGVSVEAVKKRLRRARESMRQEMLEMVKDDLGANKLGTEFVEKIRELLVAWDSKGDETSLEKAIELCPKALKVTPDDTDLLYNYGFLLVCKGTKLNKQGKVDEAKELLEKGADYYENSVALGGRGFGEWLSVTMSLGTVDKLVRLFEELVSENPRDVLALGRLARIYEQLGRLEEAEAAARRAIEATPSGVADAELLELMGDINSKLGRHDDAIACWDMAIESKPDWVVPLFSKAYHFESIGRFDDSLREWDRIIEFHHINGYVEYLDWVNGERAKVAAKKDAAC